MRSIAKECLHSPAQFTGAVTVNLPTADLLMRLLPSQGGGVGDVVQEVGFRSQGDAPYVPKSWVDN
ncbi:hypothetical protein GGE56_007672 [Rhizobium leguminosarum]|nr:hypothetical protein [Rhizobium leguminosarum]MBB6299313.1 hypothetical protein [Rhizobium leguminosarum]